MIGDNERFDELMNRLKSAGIGKSVSASEWEEVERFIEENLYTEDRIMKEFDSGKACGVRDEGERIKHHLNQIAAEHFIAGRDREAEQLRATVKRIPEPTAARSGERK